MSTGARLHIAAYMNNVSVAEIFLKYGAKVDLRDRYDRIPLHRAALSGSFEAVELLPKRGANPVAIDCRGQTPAMLASRRGHLKILEPLRKGDTLLRRGFFWMECFPSCQQQQSPDIVLSLGGWLLPIYA